MKTDLFDDCRLNGGPLNQPGPSTFYGEGPKGYTDNPARPLVNEAA